MPPEEDDRERTIRRIKALLNLGKSPNRHEAEAALAKAQELLLKHNLDMATVTSATERAKIDEENPLGTDAVEASLDAAGQPVMWRAQLAAAVATGCLCRAVRFYHPGTPDLKQGWYIAYVGRKNDIEAAKAMYAYIEAEVSARAKTEYTKARKAAKGRGAKALDAAAAVWEGFGSAIAAALLGGALTGPPVDERTRGERWRSDFCAAAVIAIHERLKAGREAFASGGPDSRAVMQQRDSEVEEAVAQAFPGMRRNSIVYTNDLEATHAGLRHGHAIPLNKSAPPTSDVRRLLGGS